MRRSASLLLLMAFPALAPASAPVRTATVSIDQALAQARSEAAAAQAEAVRLEALAAKATDEAERLRARQAAAAQAIASAEAAISAADAEARLLSLRLAEQRRRLAERQAPATSLLAGLAMMARRPPLLAIADSGSTEEFVRVRLLLDATLPEIRKRTASLSAEVARSRALEKRLTESRDSMAKRRDELALRQRQFAELEKEALRLAETRGAEALGAGDVALARGEQADLLTGDSARAAAGRRLAAELAELGPAPERPFPPESAPVGPPFAFRLPASAPVATGFGEVSRAGIRSRGLVLESRRGQPLTVPASGTIRFAGPFRRYDGVVIIDHGGGWMTLVLNARTPLRNGARVELGQPLGHALGPISVETSRNGQHVSPALIAGSSAALSKSVKRG